MQVNNKQTIPVQKNLSSLADLDQFFEDFKRHIQRHSGLDSDTSKSLLSYMQRFLSISHVFTTTEPFAFLTVETIRKSILDYAHSYGVGSYNWMRFSLRHFFLFCSYKGYIRPDFIECLPTFHHQVSAKIPKGIDPDSIEKLLLSIDYTTATGKRDYAIIQLLSTYGIRGIQLRHLCLNDINWRKSTITFPGVKGGKSIIQHLTPPVGNALLSYIREARPTNVQYNEVFLTFRPAIRPFYCSGSFSGVIVRCIQKARIELPKGVSHGTHSFRHAFATRMIGKVPLKYIADMLGHLDLTSTLIYCKVDIAQLHDATEPWPEEV